jgi:WD40 repeat protein/CheY-like chemotaxis protein
VSLETFLKILIDAGFDADTDGILDALWLGSLGLALSPGSDPSGPEIKRLVGANTPSEQLKGETPGGKGHGADGGQDDAGSEAGSGVAVDPGREEVFPFGEIGPEDRTVSASQILLPGARALPERLRLARALRPLRRRWQSAQAFELDEDATAELTANLRLTISEGVFPVMRPKAEPWYDAHLVLEDDAAIELWASPLHDFVHVLRETGAFRLVRSWRLRLDPASPGDLPRARLENPTGATFSIKVLSGDHRRLVFFASHGASLHWVDGIYAQVLRSWSGGSVVVLHLLPRLRWAHTLLGEPQAFARTPQPGSPTIALDVHTAWWRFGPEEASGTACLPTAPLEAQALGTWARMQMGLGQGSEVFLIDPADALSADELTTYRETAPDPTLAMTNLRERSPEAFDLAMRLAASPFTLPVARLVQEATGSSDFTVLADLMLSGIVVPRRANEVVVHETTYYEIHEAVRQHLLRSTRRADVEELLSEIQTRLSAHLGKITGRSVNFAGLVADPEGIEALPNWARAFARFSIGLSRQIRHRERSPERWREKLALLDPAHFSSLARLITLPMLTEQTVPAAVWRYASDPDFTMADITGARYFRPEVAAELADSLSRLPYLGVMILWVDDHPGGNRQEIAYLKMLGASIEQVTSADSVISVLLLRPPHLLISDMAQGRDTTAGIRLLRWVRERGLTLPTIIYTSRSVGARRAAAIAAGALACVDTATDLYELVKQVVPSLNLAPPDDWRTRIEMALRSMGADGASVLDRVANVDRNPAVLARALLVGGREPIEGYRRLLRFIQALLGSTVNQIVMVEETSLIVAAEALAAGARPGYKFASSTGLIGRAARTGRTVWAPDATQDKDYIAAEPNTKSELVLPVFDQRVPSQVVAVVNIEMPEVDALSARTIEWLRDAIAPLASRIPTHQPLIWISFAEEDRPIATKLIDDLKIAGFSAQPLQAIDNLNVGDTLLLLLSSFSVVDGNYQPIPFPELEAIRSGLPVIIGEVAISQALLASFPHRAKIVDLREGSSNGVADLIRAVATEWKGPPAVDSSRPSRRQGMRENASTFALEKIGELSKGHSDVILRTTWDHDGRMIATSSVDCTVCIWNVSSRRPLARLQGHTHGVNQAVWSPAQTPAGATNGNLFATCSFDRTIRIWSADTWECQRVITGHGDDIPDIAWSPDGKMLASASADKTVKIWDVTTGEPLGTWNDHADAVMRIVWLQDGGLLASSSWDGTICIRPIQPSDVGFQQIRVRVRRNAAFPLCISPDGNYLATCPADGTVQIWDWRTASLVQTLGKPRLGACRSVTFSHDGKLIAVNRQGRSDKVSIWQVDTGEQVLEFNEPTSAYWPCNIAWAPTAPTLATLGDQDQTIRVWRLTEAAQLRETAKAARFSHSIGDHRLLIGRLAYFNIEVAFEDMSLKVNIKNISSLPLAVEVNFSTRNKFLEFDDPFRGSSWTLQLASVPIGGSREVKATLHKIAAGSGVEIITCNFLRYKSSGAPEWSQWEVPQTGNSITINVSQ